MFFFFYKQKPAYEIKECDWSSDVCSSDLHEVIRIGLATLLAGSDIDIVAQAANSQEAVVQAEEHKPDVILLDIRMPDGDGLSTLEKLRVKVPDSKVVMLSTYEDRKSVV